jgi:EcsC protein family
MDAVARLAPRVARHLSWLRERYPTATSDQYAAIVTQRAARHARSTGVAAGLTGPLGAVAGLGVTTCLEALQVLEIAAAYGFDPADPRRAAELVYLTGVRDSLTAATVSTHAAIVTAAPAVGASGLHDARLWRIAATGAARLGAIRLAARLLPGAGAVLAAVTDERSSRRLAERATRFYRAEAATAPHPTTATHG